MDPEKNLLPEWVRIGQIVLTAALSILCVVGCYGSYDSQPHTQGASNSSGTESDAGVSPASSDCGDPRCDSTDDNNCNQIPDNQEASCACDPVSNPTGPCNAHPGFDGVGLCKPGTQECVVVGGNAYWGPCEGDVGPSIEACDPSAPDSNCTGISGDGVGCLSTLRIYSQLSQTACNSGVGDVINNDFSTQGQMFAGFVSPGADWVEFASFQVFNFPGTGLAPVRNCRATRGWSGESFQYVRIGDSCESFDSMIEEEDLGVVGYVATGPSPGYRALSQVLIRYIYYNLNEFIPLAYTPVLECPSFCGCGLTVFHVVP